MAHPAEATFHETRDHRRAGDEALKLDVITCNSCPSAKTGKAEKAEASLEEMCADFVSGNESVKPEVQSFNAALDARSKSAASAAPPRVEQILSRACQRFESGELGANPNAASCATVISCWANKSRQRAGGAELAARAHTCCVTHNQNPAAAVQQLFVSQVIERVPKLLAETKSHSKQVGHVIASSQTKLLLRARSILKNLALHLFLPQSLSHEHHGDLFVQPTAFQPAWKDQSCSLILILLDPKIFCWS